VSDELDRVARSLHARSAELLRRSDDVASLLGAAVLAAAERALASVPDADAEVIPERVVFTVEGELDELTGMLRARAYPIADPLGPALDLAVQGASTVGVVVDVLDGRGVVMAAASVECALRCGSRQHSGPSPPR
jgi:hypothetical protein